MNNKLLLTLLDENAKYSTTDLASALADSAENVELAIKELEDNHVILGYHTLINYDKTNINKVMAIIEVDVTPEREFGYDRIAKMIYKYSEVDTMYLMSGKSEFSVLVVGKTMQEVANFVGTKLACIEEVVGTSTYFILKQYKVDGVIYEKEEETKERMIISA
ncbi:MAG: Lrp/AsnC family transcriptional regulator [Erysipelotrichaceae bacterium]